MSVFTEAQIQALAVELNTAEKTRTQVEHFSNIATTSIIMASIKNIDDMIISESNIHTTSIFFRLYASIALPGAAEMIASAEKDVLV